jgi:hypothetical protein
MRIGAKQWSWKSLAIYLKVIVRVARWKFENISKFPETGNISKNEFNFFRFNKHDFIQCTAQNFIKVNENEVFIKSDVPQSCSWDHEEQLCRTSLFMKISFLFFKFCAVQWIKVAWISIKSCLLERKNLNSFPLGNISGNLCNPSDWPYV